MPRGATKCHTRGISARLALTELTDSVTITTPTDRRSDDRSRGARRRTCHGVHGSTTSTRRRSYDEARRIHNGLIDKRPAVIARCRTADVVRAIGFAREVGLEISIRGGGHNVAGSAVTDGGLMIDLAAMKGVQVDPQRRTARAQGGVTWGELNPETQLHGLAVTGGAISTTGIAGLTLGGGLGWLMGQHGLTVDNLLSVELVTADGDVLTVTPRTSADLFWALRGGGGNFGVVTSFEYQLHEVGDGDRRPDRPPVRRGRRRAALLP